MTTATVADLTSRQFSARGPAQGVDMAAATRAAAAEAIEALRFQMWQRGRHDTYFSRTQRPVYRLAVAMGNQSLALEALCNAVNRGHVQASEADKAELEKGVNRPDAHDGLLAALRQHEAIIEAGRR